MSSPLPARRVVRDEAGYTLTEALAALLLLSIAIAAIVGAIGSSIVSSRVHRNLVTEDTAVRAYASQLAQTTYQPCAGIGTYNPMTGAPGGMTVTITGISYWNGSNSGANFVSSCPSPDKGAQKIVITAKSTTSPATQVFSFVKRSS